MLYKEGFKLSLSLIRAVGMISIPVLEDQMDVLSYDLRFYLMNEDKFSIFLNCLRFESLDIFKRVSMWIACLYYW